TTPTPTLFPYTTLFRSEINSHIAPPIRWRFEIRSRFPVLAELVILFSFLWIGKDAISLVYFFKFFFCVLISRIHVRVMFPGKLPISTTNLLISSPPRKPKCFVVVPELNRHLYYAATTTRAGRSRSSLTL